MPCNRKGDKIRSKGKGRGKGYGDGKGPIGVPYYEKIDQDIKEYKEEEV